MQVGGRRGLRHTPLWFPCAWPTPLLYPPLASLNGFPWHETLVGGPLLTDTGPTTRSLWPCCNPVRRSPVPFLGFLVGRRDARP